MQGEANLKFIWFTMQSAGVLSIPSFNEVKQYFLPGYMPPVKVCTNITALYYYTTIIIIQCSNPSGLPFYMNTLTSIFVRCLGNSTIGEILHRFPVIPAKVVR